jgi:penicillin-binding protein 1A
VGIHAIGRRKDGQLEPIKLPDGETARNQVRTQRVLPESVAAGVQSMLQGVVKNGTGKGAAIPDVSVAGKTGTTENYSDAWFVGWTPQYTVAVWVGYPKRFQPMTTEYQGKGVAGGTYPASIWKTFMEAVLKLDPPPGKKKTDATTPTTPAAPGTPVAPTTPAPSAPAPSQAATPAPKSGGTTPTTPAPAPAPKTKTPPAQAPATQPAPAPPPG